MRLTSAEDLTAAPGPKTPGSRALHGPIHAHSPCGELQIGGGTTFSAEQTLDSPATKHSKWVHLRKLPDKNILLSNSNDVSLSKGGSND